MSGPPGIKAAGETGKEQTRPGTWDELPRDILDNLLEGCQVIGFDWTYLYLNEVVAKQGRQSKEQLLGRTMMDAYPGIERTPMFERLRRCMEQRSHERMENEFVFPDGAPGWFELSFTPVLQGAFILSVDITERKRAASRVQHLSAVLLGLRGINQLIVRERDPQVLIRRACELLVESRGFSTACVVLSQGGKVTRVADAGAPGELGKLRQMLARGQLPDCIGSMGCDQDLVVRQNPAIACLGCPVRDDHPAYRDTVALRLEYAGNSYGALLVSMPPHSAIDPDEQSLLREAAGDIAFALSSIETRSNQRLSEEALRASEEGFEELFRNLDSGVGVFAAVDDGGDFVFRELNAAGEAMGKFRRAEVMGRRLTEVFPGIGEMGLLEVLRRVWQSGKAERQPIALYQDDRIAFWAETSVYRLASGELVAISRDLTEQRSIEDQLRASQKLEAVGQLAGGIAHDFNNLLAVILSFSGFALESLREGDPVHEDILEISKAAERAAALTRQLLAFSRKQVLQPEILDLNAVVSRIEGMMRRIIGEDIDLKTVQGTGLGKVKADPGQLEQVLMNLVVNSRDAMPDGGRLTIETANAELDEVYASQHTAVKPGPYVRLAVTDTGCGMDEKVRARLFEPFFTTKPQGKGTGLGLATVFGIVKQSGGNIWVYSEPGKGTTFKVYLPRELGQAVASSVPPRAAIKSTGDETILVVEDESAVRLLAKRILDAAGYKVLMAANGGEALLLCERHPEVHLVLTDVVMPQMGGGQLAERLAKVCPGLRVLYMSGYADNAIVHHGVLDTGTNFIAKPFAAAELTAKVREVLDQQPGG